MTLVIPIIAIDVCSVIVTFICGLFLYDWIESGYEYYGDYVKFGIFKNHRVVAIIWFPLSAVACALSVMWIGARFLTVVPQLLANSVVFV